MHNHRAIVESDALLSLHNDYWYDNMPDISDMPTIRHSDMLLYQKKKKQRGTKKIRLKPHSVMKGVAGAWLNEAYDYCIEKCVMPVRFRDSDNEMVDLVRRHVSMP